MCRTGLCRNHDVGLIGDGRCGQDIVETVAIAGEMQAPTAANSAVRARERLCDDEH